MVFSGNFFRRFAINEHKYYRRHAGCGGEDKACGKTARRFHKQAAEPIENHGGEAQPQHGYAVVGAAETRAAYIRSHCGKGGGGAAVGKGGQGDDCHVKNALRPNQSDGADCSERREKNNGVCASDFVRGGSHAQTSRGVGDARYAYGKHGNAFGQAAFHAETFDDGHDDIPRRVDKKAAQSYAPKGEKPHRPQRSQTFRKLRGFILVFD